MQILEEAEPLISEDSRQMFQELTHKDQNVDSTAASGKEPSHSISLPTVSIAPLYPGVSRLLPCLYLCGASVLSPTVLAQLGIDCVINVAPELPDTPLPPSGNTLYLRIDVADRADVDLAKHFDEVADLIEEVRQSGGKTLVHCVAGVSRSASLCLAYLVRHAGMSLKEAFQHVKNARPQIRPNSGFFQQLRNYEELCHGTQSVKMVFLECLQREIPEVYEVEFRPMEEFYQKQRQANRAKSSRRTVST